MCFKQLYDMFSQVFVFYLDSYIRSPRTQSCCLHLEMELSNGTWKSKTHKMWYIFYLMCRMMISTDWLWRSGLLKWKTGLLRCFVKHLICILSCETYRMALYNLYQIVEVHFLPSLETLWDFYESSGRGSPVRGLFRKVVKVENEKSQKTKNILITPKISPPPSLPPPKKKISKRE